MLNRFQVICNKLYWPVGVQIEKFLRILPMNLRQFVVSRAHDDFAEVALSVKMYQELIEVDTEAHIFKNVSFCDILYELYVSEGRYNSFLLFGLTNILLKSKLFR